MRGGPSYNAGSGAGAEGFFQVQLLSMINVLKTGDPTVDMVLAMVLPYIIGQLSRDLWKWAHKLWLAWRGRKVKVEKEHERTITYRSAQTVNGGTVDFDKDSHNLVLIRAIQLYVHEECYLDLTQADLDLTTFEGGKNNQKNMSPVAARRNQAAMSSSSGWLKSCSLVERPLPRRFYNVGTYADNKVELWLDDSLNGNKKGGGKDSSKNNSQDEGGSSGPAGMRNMEVRLKSKSKESIFAFVKTAFDWYVSRLEQMENSDRYFFDLRNVDGNGFPSYKRYKLGDEKTFDSLFSKQCHDLIKIVDQFQTKTGKYRIKGIPHKLGILLSGPPGTGKTSLIKAMANYTNRHIVNVPLSRVATNAALMGMLFNNKYQTDDASGAFTTLDYNQVIFVLEDVDASSKIVKDRTLLAAEEEAERIAMQEEQAAVQQALAKEGKEATPARVQRRLGIGRPSVPNASARTTDELNLTGLLNALDGVVDSPGRIVIMSTNCPEMLDPALTRPGRIDKQLVMGYMIASDMVAMIEHYFETILTFEQTQRIKFLIEDEGLKMTAAALEQLTIEVDDDVDELLDLLHKQVQPDPENTISPSPSATECTETSANSSLNSSGHDL